MNLLVSFSFNFEIIMKLWKISSCAFTELYLSQRPPELHVQPESALTFYRQFVAQNRPVIIRNGIKSWPAFRLWQNHDYLLKKLNSDKLVNVAITPNGYADAITEGKFVMPHEESMKFKDFIDIIENPSQHKGIHYIQRQNSNLSEEMNELIEDISELQWAREAFGKDPDAVNFWMGDSRAVTSTHKDPYENIYCVIKGQKDIILFPPTDVPWLPYKSYKQAVFKTIDGGDHFSIEEIEEAPEIPWIAIDPLNPDLETYPDFQNAHPVRITLKAGDVLYLPSLWFHHLRQSHGCIAVNFWYDMEFDGKFNYFNFVNEIKNLLDDT